MNKSDSLAQIAPALVKALAEIDGVAKTKANPGFKGSKYATLEAVIDASKDTLTKHGLTVLQFAGPTVNSVLTMETMILHESGEFLSGEFGIAVGKMDPQGIGSAVTYARRYGLMAALNMPAVDDDGEAAMGRNHSQPPVDPSEFAIKDLNSSKTLEDMQGVWTKNAGSWRNVMSDEQFAKVEKVKDSLKITLGKAA